MRYGIVRDEWAARIVYEAAERAIVGYDAHRAAADTSRRQDRLDKLFRGKGPAPAATAIVAATDDSGTELYGAVVLDTPYNAGAVIQDLELGRQLARLHRIVSGLFVVDEHRGAGLGTQLLREEAAMCALVTGARYIEGFVDDRNGSADFYRRAGLTVLPHNTGLPARRPTNTPLTHESSVDGHWFYLDLWAHYADRMQCKECGSGLAFVPGDGGDLTCPRMRVDAAGQRVHE
ncbi:GNAT family N-acetyltransferase [Cellulosimicrobium sp. BIT-GX5]|uniref:GNAT family N-acetyltransferase n=1 Tax=Cellulosimicrobium composti TaxID=2672572 RepID=A0A6N7ZNB5_9MICO|nr:GNAT family N-acetyltransferase [Cellulosimicrobium composti]